MASDTDEADREPAAKLPTYEIESASDGLVRVRLSGGWVLVAGIPATDRLESALSDADRVEFDGDAITDWDSGLLTFVARGLHEARERSVEVDCRGLPEGAQRLLDLASAVPERETRRPKGPVGRLARIGDRALVLFAATTDVLEFVGDVALAFGRFCLGKARFRRSDLGVAVQEAGVEALGIVSLISFLVGLILAFMGAAQLQLFGAEIYVASLVALGSAREMAPLMTGIIMAGRTGAAYAAQLGTMTVNEEIDSLRALAISPMEFLVLPRMLALVIMMPILTVYSNLLTIAGGFVVGTTMLGISPQLYWNQTVEAVGIDDFAIGIVKSAVLGALIAIAGCMRGMRCGRNASAVGLATTSAVVTGIVAIVVSEAVFAVVLQVLGI